MVELIWLCYHGFSGPAEVPEMVSGCTVRLSSNGGLLQYLTTASQLLYEGKYGRGQDGCPFGRQGFGKYLLCVCQLLSMKKTSVPYMYLQFVGSGGYLWDHIYCPLGFYKYDYKCWPDSIKRIYSDITSRSSVRTISLKWINHTLDVSDSFGRV